VHFYRNASSMTQVRARRCREVALALKAITDSENITRSRTKATEVVKTFW